MVTVLQYTEGNEHFCDRDRIFGDNQFLQIFIATAAEFPGDNNIRRFHPILRLINVVIV